MVTNKRIIHNKINKLVDLGVISSIDKSPNSEDISKSDIFSLFDERLFSGTWIYIPDQLFRMTCNYRDMYAFILSIFVILNKCHSNSNPNKIYSDEIYRIEKNNKGPIFGSERNLSLEDMLSDVPSNSNLLYKYYIDNLDTPFAKHAQLLFDIAIIVKHAGDAIKTSPLTKYEYYQERHRKILTYKPRTLIINTDAKIYSDMYTQIDQLFKSSKSAIKSSNSPRPSSSRNTTRKLKTAPKKITVTTFRKTFANNTHLRGKAMPTVLLSTVTELPSVSSHTIKRDLRATSGAKTNRITTLV